MRLRPDQWALVLVGIVLAAAVIWQAGKPRGLQFRVDGPVAFVNGTTTGRDQGAVRALLREHPQVTTLVFEQMPGTRDVTSNYRLARTIREAGLDTHLRPTSRIASGAVDLFLAGAKRSVACGAMIGVHSWGGTGYDAQDVRFDPHRPMSRDFLADMGVDPDFYDFRTRMAGSDAIHWMSDAEIERWGVATEPRACDQSSSSSE